MWNACPTTNLDESYSKRQLFQILQTENLLATPCNVDLCSSTTEDTLDSNVDAATKVVTNPINFGG